MAFRQVLSKVLVPNLERDLTKSIGSELATVSTMTDCLLSPNVYGYESISTTKTMASGAFAKTGVAYDNKSIAASGATKDIFVKVEFPAPTRGLFYE